MIVCAEVHVVRGGIIESRHHVQAVLVSGDGAVPPTDDAEGLTTSFRSAAKPFQLLPFVERGHAAAMGMTDADLAIMTASHSGSRLHLDHVRHLLTRLGLDASRLVCGYHDPMDPTSLEDLRLDPSLKSPLYNNCSGKHTGMLACCAAEGWPLQGYEKPEHPLQQLLLRTLSECCGIAPSSIALGIDGCSLPVFGLPLSAMATGYARFARAIAHGGGPREQALQRIGKAMASHPILVEGEGRLATDLMRVTHGRIIAKSGAEGLLLVADPTRGAGVAIKCEDGAMRAVGPAAIEILGDLDMLASGEMADLSAHRRSVVADAAGHAVGHLEARIVTPPRR